MSLNMIRSIKMWELRWAGHKESINTREIIKRFGRETLCKQTTFDTSVDGMIKLSEMLDYGWDSAGSG